MRVIVAAADAMLRDGLVSALHAAGWPVGALAVSTADLQRQLERLETERDGATLVVTGAERQRAEGFAQIALERGVPVALWPLADSASLSHERPAAELRMLGDSHGDGSKRRLTEREREVLALVAAGISNKGIARRLRLSPNTVKFHLTAIFAKLDASTRAEAVAAAARRGELSL